MKLYTVAAIHRVGGIHQLIPRRKTLQELSSHTTIVPLLQNQKPTQACLFICLFVCLFGFILTGCHHCTFVVFCKALEEAVTKRSKLYHSENLWFRCIQIFFYRVTLGIGALVKAQIHFGTNNFLHLQLFCHFMATRELLYTDVVMCRMGQLRLWYSIVR